MTSDCWLNQTAATHGLRLVAQRKVIRVLLELQEVTESMDIPFDANMPIPEDAPEGVKQILQHMKEHQQRHEIESSELTMRINRLYDEIPLEHLHTLHDILDSLRSNEPGERQASAVAYFFGITDATGRIRHQNEDGDIRCTYCRESAHTCGRG